MKNPSSFAASAAPANSRFAPLTRPTFWPIIVMLLLLAGCTLYPLGLSKEQWESLTPAQQAEYRARQAEVDAQNYRAAEAARLQREQEARERAQQEQQRIAARYAHARYGDIITVTIRGGMVAFNGKRYAYEPVSFDLIRGEVKPVTFFRQGHSHTTTEVEMALSEDGNTFYFDYPARKRFVAIKHDWERGRAYHPSEIGSHDGHSEAVGITIDIRFRRAPTPPMPPPPPPRRH